MKGIEKIAGYLILFLQEQAKEFYSCTKPVTFGWIRSKWCSVQIIHLTSIWFLCSGQWPWWKSRCQIDHPEYLEEMYMLFFTLEFSLRRMILALSEETSRLATQPWRVIMITELSYLLLDFLIQSRSKYCSMSDSVHDSTCHFQVLQNKGLLMHAVKYAACSTVTVLSLHLLVCNLDRGVQPGSRVRSKIFTSECWI